MKSSAAAYGAGATGDFTTVGDLTVSGGKITLSQGLTMKDEDDDRYLELEGADAAYIGVHLTDDATNYCMLRYNKAAHQMEYYTPQTHIFAGGNVQIDTALTDATDTMTIAQMADLMMFGSANAAWVPCSVFAIDDFADATFSGGALSNVGANDYLAAVKIPLPVAKGSLKLYITGYRFIIFDADATNKVTASYLYGFDSDGANTLITSDGTDYDAQGTHTKSFSEDDWSGHSGLFIYYTTDVADANALDIKGIQVQCYYDT